MFWGVAVENGKRYSQVVETSYHISMAALEPRNKSTTANAGKLVSLMLEHSKTEFLICTLEYNRVMQVNLDLNFVEGEEVTFYVNGEGTIHLTGYIVSEEDIEEDAMSDSSVEEVTDIRKSLVKASPNGKSADLLNPVADVDDDEEEEDDDWVPPQEDESSKRRKSENGVGQSPSSKKLKVETKPKSKLKDSREKIADEAVDEDDEMNSEESSSGSDSDSDDGSHANEDDNDDNWDSDEEEENAGEKVNASKGSLAKNFQVSKNAKSASKGSSKKSPVSSFSGTPTARGAFAQKSPTAKNTKKAQSPDSKFQMNTLAGGVMCQDVIEGKGEVASPGKTLKVYYTGRLASNNKEFDSQQSGSPFSFKLGKGQVIKGWDVALKGMKVGGKRKIIVPPSMGYGSKKSGPIPPNSTLQFDVELKAVSK